MIPIAKPLIDNEEIEEVIKVLKSGFIAQGPKVAFFEEVFGEYIGTKHAAATSSGTTALHLALLAAGIGSGDEVITTPFTFIATTNSVLYVGAKPVFADIDPGTYNLDPGKIEDVITDKTKAMIPVHLYGQPADMDAICKIARDHDIKVIEDAAQAHGARFKGKNVGSFGDAACFSFYPTKNMTTSEGGMITTNNHEIDQTVRTLRAHGEKERYEHSTLGYNFRMTDIAAAIGIAQLKKLEKFNQKRIENAEYLTEHIEKIDGIEPPFIQENVHHVFHQYTIKVDGNKRDELIRFLNDHLIGTGIHYPIPVYKQKLYQDLGIHAECREAEKAAAEVVSIPVHPALKVDDLEKIVQTLEDASGSIL